MLSAGRLDRGILLLGAVATMHLTVAPSTAQEPTDTLKEPADTLVDPSNHQPADTVRLRELVVTATRVPRPLDMLTSSVTVLDGERLAARGVDRILEALRGVAGGTIVRGGSVGGTASFFLRGGESDYVQVLIDGVPANRPGGRFDFGALSAANIERIEIVRGPVSVLYGSDAVTGVVQIFTRRGGGEPRVRFGVRGGSYGALKLEAGLLGGGETVDYSFAVSRFRTDGLYPINSEFNNTVVSGRVRLRPDDRTTADLSLRYGDRVYHYPTNGAGAVVDSNSFDFRDALTVGLSLGRRIGDRWNARLQLTLRELDGGIEDAPDGPADTLGLFGFHSLRQVSRRGADLQVDFQATESAVVTAGAAIERQELRSFNRSLSAFGASAGSFDASRRNAAVYAQALAEPLSGLSLSAGGRLDWNEAFGSFATWRAGAVYALSDRTRIRAAFGTAFKEPSFFENFATGFVTGNPNLEPEEARSWEIGIERELLGAARFSATWFDQRFRNMIQYTPNPPEPAAPSYFNVAQATSSGLELRLRLAPRARWSARVNYTYLDTEVVDAGFASGPGAALVDGEPLLRRPRHAASAIVDYRPFERLGLHARVRYVGERADRDFRTFPARRITLDSYTILGAGAEFELPGAWTGPSGITLNLDVENVLDTHYVEVANFPSPGRTIFVGASVGLGG